MRGETVTVLSARTVDDPYSSSPVEDWSNPVERSVETLAPAEPRPSFAGDEPMQDARNSVTSGFTLYLPAGDPITRKDRVRVRGEVYPVRGTPAAWGHFGIVVQAFSEED
jgi:hypothetical protein